MFAVGGTAVVVALFIAMSPKIRLGTATLSIDSDPPNAEVRIDGVGVGTTPLETDAISGEHLIRVSLPYREAYEERIEVGRGDVVKRSLVLAPTYGSLLLMSNPRGAWVELNGVRRDDVTPTRFDGLVAGMYTLRVGTDDHRPVSEEVEVRPDQTTEHVVELHLIAKGHLTITAVPEQAKITLPDLDIDYAQAMRLPLGQYRVQAELEGYGTKTVRVGVVQEQNLHRITLEKLYGRVYVEISPPDAQVLVTYAVGRDTMRVPYFEAMRVPTGEVNLRARAMGYRTQAREIRLRPEGATVKFALTKLNIAPGRTFRDPLEDGTEGPAMVVISPGSFRMGSDGDGASLGERPAHDVTITQPFAISKFEITRAQYTAYVRATGEPGKPVLVPTELARHPAVHVEFNDAEAYAEWLSGMTGERYRLPSEAEWEYVARAGSAATYFFGEDENEICRYANIADERTKERFQTWDVVACDDGHAKLAPAGNYEPNAFGVHDIYGNAAEWVSDCWHFGYEGAPADGSAWTGGFCQSRVVRGGSWDSKSDDIRSAARYAAVYSSDDRGIRLIREL